MTQESRESPTRPGPLTRLRSWLSRDPEPSIQQLRAEWAEYQLIFNDLLQRWSAKLAREAKMEAKRQQRIAAQLEEVAPDHRTPPAVQLTGKAALRSRFAAQMLGGSFPTGRNGGFNVDPDQGEPGTDPAGGIHNAGDDLG